MECRHLLAERRAHQVGAEIVDGADPLAVGRRNGQTGVDQRALISRVCVQELGRTRRP